MRSFGSPSMGAAPKARSSLRRAHLRCRPAVLVYSSCLPCSGDISSVSLFDQLARYGLTVEAAL